MELPCRCRFLPSAEFHKRQEFAAALRRIVQSNKPNCGHLPLQVLALSRFSQKAGICCGASPQTTKPDSISCPAIEMISFWRGKNPD